MKAIPVVQEPERYTRSQFQNSPFVEIVTNDRFEVNMQYPILGMQHAERHCFFRKEAYERLQEAADKLPRGYRFQILDAWRPFALQHELYEEYREDIIRQFQLGNCEAEYQASVIRRFVSDPVSDHAVPPVHTTGGAIDLTIVDAEGKPLDMGSGFDEFSDRTYTAYYEKEGSQNIRDNRRLLYHIMTEAGFTNLPSEWWHYDYGDRFWAFYKQCDAIYEGVFTKEEMDGSGTEQQVCGRGKQTAR